MTDDNPNSPLDVQARLDAHLDKVDDILKRYGKSRTDRAAIVDGLADQINEMLATETAGQEPTLDHLETVLSKIDPPEAYAQQSIDLAVEPGPPGFASEAAAPVSRFNLATAFGLGWLVWMFLGIGVLVLLSETRVDFINQTYVFANQTWWGILLTILLVIPGLLAPVGTTILGWVGISQIKNSHGRQHGLGLAVFNALCFVVLAICTGIGFLLIGAPLFLVSEMSKVHDDFSGGVGQPSPRLLLLIGLPLTLVTLAVAYWLCRRIIRATWQKANEPVEIA